MTDLDIDVIYRHFICHSYEMKMKSATELMSVDASQIRFKIRDQVRDGMHHRRIAHLLSTNIIKSLHGISYIFSAIDVVGLSSDKPKKRERGNAKSCRKSFTTF